MSRGRYCMMWTALADLLGLGLSYLYGALLAAWVGSWLPAPLGFVRIAAGGLYTHLVIMLPLPHPLQGVLLHNAGLTWLVVAVQFRLAYLVGYLYRRAASKDLGKPFPGAPGGEYWGIVQRRFDEYREAVKRWSPAFPLRTPTWCYYKRQGSGQPDLFWRGRKLVIEKDLLRRERLHELRPYLARELMYYNSEDLAFKDVLAYYPDWLSWWLILWHLLGFCVLLPPMLTKWYIWPGYWERRTLVADAFACHLWQGHLLYYHIEMQVQQEERLKQERREVMRQITELENQIRAFEREDKTDDYSLSGFSSSDYHSYHNPSNQLYAASSQCYQQLQDLRRREAQLLEQEQQSLEIRPMLEERREQLVGMLRNEQNWLEEHGIPAYAPTIALHQGQEAQRQIHPSR
jgi:hypothetical protein